MGSEVRSRPATVAVGDRQYAPWAMATIRLFAGAREAAGTDRSVVDGATVGAVLDAAVDRFGPGFAAVLASCKIWVNGEPADRDDALAPDDEVAVLPPVSGGS